jgi:hypothetical protein
MWTASAHIITAVIGSGVLSLGWAIAQLGWVAGPVVMLLFSLVTYYTSSLLADCYRSGDPSTGKRNYTYMDAVNANLSACPSAFVPLLPTSLHCDFARVGDPLARAYSVHPVDWNFVEQVASRSRSAGSCSTPTSWAWPSATPSLPPLACCE